MLENSMKPSIVLKASEINNTSLLFGTTNSLSVVFSSSADTLRVVVQFIGLSLPLVLVILAFTLYMIVPCRWRSGNPSVYTRCRRVGLSPVVMHHRSEGAKFHPLYIPRRPRLATQQSDFSHLHRGD